VQAYKNPTFVAPDRRYKLMKVSPELLLVNLFNGSISRDFPDGNVLIQTVSHDMPEGTQIEAVTFDDYSRCFMFRLWRADWPEIAEAAHIPDINVTFTSRDFTLTPEASGMWSSHPSFWLELGEKMNSPETEARIKELEAKIMASINAGNAGKPFVAPPGIKLADIKDMYAKLQFTQTSQEIGNTGDIRLLAPESEETRKVNFREFL